MPVLDTDDSGNPVGLWIRLTVGNVTRLGYGSVPSGQPDAVKVLIGDALRNAAMRFGVALDLWAKGDRADPTAENATASAGKASRNGRAPQKDEAEKPEPPDDAAVADWGTRIDGFTCQEDATRADAELRTIFKAGKMNPTTANAIRAAIKMKAAKLPQPEMAGASS